MQCEQEKEKMKKIAIQMESAWLSQLATEFDNICYQYRLQLRPPILQISRSTRVLGSWEAQSRNLSISSHLILQHPWRITLQVLKHEIAHQICSEIYRDQKNGHGEGFKKACSLIGVDQCFLRAAADTAEALCAWQQEEGRAPQQHILDKIKKLFALGQSGNEHEAALALQKAGNLLRQHNLSMAHLVQSNDLTHRTIDTKKQRMAVHLKVISSLLDGYFGVRVIHATQYDPYLDKVHKTIELMGTKGNVTIAEHCYYFLEERLDTLWKSHQGALVGDRRMAKKSYSLGLLAGFKEKLASEKKASATRQESEREVPMEKALLKTEAMLDVFVTKRFPRLRTTKTKKMHINPDVYQKGCVTGKKLHLRQPMDGGQELLLLSKQDY